jgi:hypothetical protein
MLFPSLGLKRKFSCSYFREKFFSLFAKKAYYKKLQKFSRKLSQKNSFLQKFSRKFFTWNAECVRTVCFFLNVYYPDPKQHWWMLAKYHLKKFRFWRKLRENKNICNMGENLSQKRNFSRKQIFVGTQIFWQTLSKTKVLAKSERIIVYFRILRK